MRISSEDRIKIVSEAEEEIVLRDNKPVRKVNTKSKKGKCKKKIIVLLMVLTALSTVFALFLVNKQPKKTTVNGQLSPEVSSEVKQLINQLDLAEKEPQSSFDPSPTQQIPGVINSSRISAIASNLSQKSYKKIISPQSSYYSNHALNFYINKRRKIVNHLIASYKKQEKPEHKKRLTQLNLTQSQYLRALTLIEHSPFLQFKNAQLVEVIDEQRQYYQNRYNISSYGELPMCIVVPSFRNFKRYRYYFNLYTILQQQYQNYHVVIIDDASDDKTAQSIEYQLKHNNVARQKVKLIKNARRQYHMANIYKAVLQQCRKGELLLIVDGDDELIGKYVFKLINAAYHRLKSLAIYTNHIQSKRQVLLDVGISKPYTQEVKDSNNYRFQRHYYSHLRSIWVDLFLLIKEDDFKDNKGKWFTNAVDNAIYYPAFEMACGEIEYLNEITYKYNTYTGNNIDNMEEEFRRSTSKEIREKKTYRCLKEWNNQAYQRIKSYVQ